MTDAQFIEAFAGRMLLGNGGQILAFLACALALFGVFAIGRRCVRWLPQGAAGAADPEAAAFSGVAPASLEALEARLREAGVTDAQIPVRLRQAARALTMLRERLEDERPDVLALIDDGKFAAASAALARSGEAGGDEAAERDPAAAQKDAEICAAAAALDHLALDYRGAAEKFARAAELAAADPQPQPSAGPQWRFRMAQAQALAEAGAGSGDSDSLRSAIETYGQALDAVCRAESPFAWAATQFHRADALVAAGVSANAPESVEEAVASYRLALEEWTHDAAPFDWARTQHNLGEALQRLAEMENGVERLRPAAEAYRAALREWTRRAAPDLFAMAQGNLGDALAVLGARTGDEALLREAVRAYRAALGELRRDVAPREWTRMQNNLGNALEALAEQEFCERKFGREQLRQAVEAFEDALAGQTPDNAPAEFAATSLNLGDALLALGESEAAQNPAYGADLLRRAAAAYRAALAAQDETPPVDVAKIKVNLAYTLGLLWNGARQRELLHEALAMNDGAIAAIIGTADSQHVADAERAREKIMAALAQAA